MGLPLRVTPTAPSSSQRAPWITTGGSSAGSVVSTGGGGTGGGGGGGGGGEGSVVPPTVGSIVGVVGLTEIVLRSGTDELTCGDVVMVGTVTGFGEASGVPQPVAVSSTSSAPPATAGVQTTLRGTTLSRVKPFGQDQKPRRLSRWS